MGPVIGGEIEDIAAIPAIQCIAATANRVDIALIPVAETEPITTAAANKAVYAFVTGKRLTRRASHQRIVANATIEVLFAAGAPQQAVGIVTAENILQIQPRCTTDQGVGASFAKQVLTVPRPGHKPIRALAAIERLEGSSAAGQAIIGPFPEQILVIPASALKLIIIVAAEKILVSPAARDQCIIVCLAIEVLKLAAAGFQPIIAIAAIQQGIIAETRDHRVIAAKARERINAPSANQPIIPSITQDAVSEVTAKDVFNPRQAVSAIRAGCSARAEIDRDRARGRGIASQIRARATGKLIITSTAAECIIAIDATQEFTTGAAKQAIVSGHANKLLTIARACDQRVISVIAKKDLIFAVSGLQSIGTVAATEHLTKVVAIVITPTTADHAIGTVAAIKSLLVAPARDQRIIPSFAKELLIIAIPALQAIGIVAAQEGLIIAPARDQRVIAGFANERLVRAVPALQPIGTVPAIEPLT